VKKFKTNGVLFSLRLNFN